MLDYTDKNKEDTNNENGGGSYPAADGGTNPTEGRNYSNPYMTNSNPVPTGNPYGASQPANSYNNSPYPTNSWYGTGSYGPSSYNNTYTSGPATLEQPPAPPVAPVTPPVQPAPAPQQPPARRRGPGWLALIGAVLAAVILSGLVTFGLTSNSNSKNTTSQVAPTTAASSTATGTTVAASLPNTSGLLSVQQVSDQVRPAVVQITAQQNTGGLDSIFGGGSSNNGSGTVDTGVGSGVIYDKAGYILTNSHVVDGADSLVVTLPDGRTFQGTLVGQDRQTDLAVVKVDPAGANLPVATLGDSSQLKVGDGLVAIGNALALPGGPTVTSGVVSALDRSVQEPGSSSGSNSPFGAQTQTAGPQLYGLIQTDAAINPGNSGGALVDMHGQVVGINTLVAGQAEPGVQAQGIGFAISINQAKQISQQLVTNGKVSHPFIGISYQLLTPATAQRLGLDIKEGSVVMQVQQGSPAAKAGLKRGDVITAIDGQKLNSESALGQILNNHKPGDTIKLDVTSPKAAGGNGQSRSVQVTLGERPANS